jgi:hypothetical protein
MWTFYWKNREAGNKNSFEALIEMEARKLCFWYNTVKQVQARNKNNNNVTMLFARCMYTKLTAYQLAQKCTYVYSQATVKKR